MPTFHRCAVSEPGGQVLGRDIRVALEESAGSGPGRWYGTITVTHDLTTLVAGQAYRIVLDDGRSGAFRVRRNTLASDVDRAVAIDGMEPLQARP